MHLISGTVALLEADLTGPQALAAALGTPVPASWPPDLYDPPAIQWSLQYLREHPESAGWVIWYLVLKIYPVTVGIIGFKGLPKPTPRSTGSSPRPIPSSSPPGESWRRTDSGSRERDRRNA